MAWRDDLRPASFRGVPFHVADHDRDIGRRVQVNEYPKRDGATTEDMGLRAPSFRIEGFVVGPDYMAERDALIDALNKAGPGELIHPYYGLLSVTLIGQPRVRDKAGQAVFSLEFIEEAGAPQPSETADLKAEVDQAAADLTTQAEADFASGFSVAGKPAWVFAEAQNVIGAAQFQIETIANQLAGYGAPYNVFIGQGMALRTNILQLASRPGGLASALSGTVQVVRKLASTPADAFRLLKSMLGFGSGLPAPPRTTPSRTLQADNQIAIVNLVRHVVASEVVLAASEIEFVAYEEADAARTELADGLEVLAVAAADAGQDAVWRCLTAARQTIIADISARGADLARIYGYTPVVTEPALVIAHRLYGADDLDARHDDLVARNRIQHPGFVTGGKALEVLTDD